MLPTAVFGSMLLLGVDDLLDRELICQQRAMHETEYYLSQRSPTAHFDRVSCEIYNINHHFFYRGLQ